MISKTNLFFLLLAAVVLFSCDLRRPVAEDYWRGEFLLSDRNDRKNLAEITSQENSSRDFLAPFAKPGNAKFRIGIIISGEYWEFLDSIKGMLSGFENIGWAKHLDIPLSITNSYQFMEWLSRHEYSDYIEFPLKHFYNLDWGANTSDVLRSIRRQKPDADLFLVYGGMAGRLLYQMEDFSIPVIADAITDCFAAGVTVSETDSGKDFFTNNIDIEQYRNQVRLFHDIVQFSRLGIVYGDDEYGIIYGAVRDIEAVAAERGFEIIRNTTVKEDMDFDTVDLYLAALKNVVSKADAVYIGASTAVTEYEIMPHIVKILEDAKIPSFALEGSIRVKDGILFGISNSRTIRSGINIASKATHIFGGASARMLDQRFENIPSVAINLETAGKIGFNIPLELIINVDEVYTARNKAEPVTRNTGKELEYGFKNYAAVSSDTDSMYYPVYKDGGKLFRIAVIQSGEYWEFDEHFRGIIAGLVQNGWAHGGIEIPADLNISQTIRALGKFSDYIEFPPHYIINLAWGSNVRAANSFFSGAKPDVDIIIAFGGVAGRLFNPYKEYPIPVLMEGITDPLATGVIYSNEDSGKDFVTCRVDPRQYQRQVQLFHDIAGFSNLGLIYGDNEDGRLYSAVHDVEIVARKKGFNLIRNTNVKETAAADTPRLYLAALQDICKQVDAVYLGASTALTEYNIIDDVVQILNNAKMPSFALEGDIRVRQGILFGISTLETEKFGLYNANKIAAIFHGVSPRMLKQTMEGMPSIVFNLDTALKIDFQVPLDVLSIVDQLVHKGKIIKR